MDDPTTLLAPLPPEDGDGPDWPLDAWGAGAGETATDEDEPAGDRHPHPERSESVADLRVGWSLSGGDHSGGLCRRTLSRRG